MAQYRRPPKRRKRTGFPGDACLLPGLRAAGLRTSRPPCWPCVPPTPIAPPPQPPPVPALPWVTLLPASVPRCAGGDGGPAETWPGAPIVSALCNLALGRGLGGRHLPWEHGAGRECAPPDREAGQLSEKKARLLAKFPGPLGVSSWTGPPAGWTGWGCGGVISQRQSEGPGKTRAAPREERRLGL